MYSVGFCKSKALRKSGVKCEGINFLLADGKAAGQKIFHVHMHIFPRFVGDGFGFKFGPDYDNKPNHSFLDEVARKNKEMMPTG